MNKGRPDQHTVQALIALGHCEDDPAGIGEFLKALATNTYVANLAMHQNFEWLQDIPWADGCAIVRAVVHLESARLTKSGGSASAIKTAYQVMEAYDRVAAMELAAWIVNKSDNDYVPFPMRKIRHAFEVIKVTATSWAECRKELDRWCDAEWGRQNRVAEEMATQELDGERRRKIRSAVGVRVNVEQTAIQQARATALTKLLNELRSLPIRDRLEHIAWDDAHSLSCYPTEFAACTAADLNLLDQVTRERFSAKLRQHKKGPWRKLAAQLGLVGT